jgi:hypothetical protein
MRKEKHVKEFLLDATVAPSLVTINQIIQKMNYKGKTIYLPPKYFSDLETKIYVPKQNDGKLPSPEQIQNQEQSIFIEKPKGMLLTPVGEDLTKLFEKILGTNFIQENLINLQKKLPKLLIEKLEIAQDFEMTTAQNKIHVKIENPIYSTLYEGSLVTNENITDPLSSALAIILAKTVGKPVIINKQKKEDNILEIEFQIFEEE